jgi:IclR family acetate operon transcriptional repressor
VPNAEPNYPIGSVDRALRLLTSFRDRPSATLSQIAEELGVSRSSAHRLLAMFVYHGYVRQDAANKEYVAGPVLLEVGLGVLRQMAVMRRARPLMGELFEELGETVHLVVLNGSDMTFVDGIESTKPLRAGLRVGASLPAHATAGGKALLAQLSDEQLRKRFPQQRLTGMTPATIGRRDDLMAEIAQIRERGFALNDGESEVGLYAIATAFPDPTGITQAAMTIATPSVRMDDARALEVGTHLFELVRDATA